MRTITKKHLTLRQKQEILKLWNKEYPRDLRYAHLGELEDYLGNLKDQHHVLLVDENETVKGWYADFIRDDERWFIAILDAECQGRGLGRKLMELAKGRRPELHGWVVYTDNYKKADGQPYKSPVDFYKKLGFDLLPDMILETDKIRVMKIRWSNRGNNNG